MALEKPVFDFYQFLMRRGFQSEDILREMRNQEQR